MPISNKDRKKLWGRSGNQCALCGLELAYGEGINLNLGQECHIVSSKPLGPRFRPLEDYEVYENQIVLCANHHIEIDTNESFYTENKLRAIKAEHEDRISKAHKYDGTKEDERSELLQLVVSRKSIRGIAMNPFKLSLVSGLTIVFITVSFIFLLIKYSLFKIPMFVPQIATTLIALSSFCLLTGFTLYKRKFVLLIRNYSLESQQNKIILMRTEISCPQCQSKMWLYLDQQIGMRARCERNPIHIIDFDYTKL
jgi:hypothetical protein